MSVFSQITAWFQDPPPEFVFEIASDRIAVCRTRPPFATREVALQAGVITATPGKDNITNPAAFASAVQGLIPSNAKRRTAALLIPDNSVRIALLEFEKLPEKEEERRALVKFRLRKTIPFDIDEAALAWFVQPGNRVVAVAAPVEVVARYEAPFRAAGLQPGLVMPSSLALLVQQRTPGLIMLARLGSGSLSVFAVRDGVIVLARVLELTAGTDDPLAEIVEDLYPTLVYLEDQTGERPRKLMLAGFGVGGAEAAVRLGRELETETEVITAPFPGIAGYLASLGIGEKVAA